MNRSELIDRISDKLRLNKSDVLIFVKAWEEELENALKQDDSVILRDFGTFSLWKQTGRPGRNPKYNTPCMIAPRNSVKFKPSKQMLEHLNDDKTESNNQLAKG